MSELTYSKCPSCELEFADHNQVDVNALRQQVAELTKRIESDDYADELWKESTLEDLTELKETLALRDLEILDLREAFLKHATHKVDCTFLPNWIDAECNCGLFAMQKALSTPFTPSDLNAYVEAEIEKRLEVVAYKHMMLNDTTRLYSWADQQNVDVTKAVPLYALRKEKV